MDRQIIVFLGPQGSGKGTQAELLSDHLGISVITMSNLLREEIAKGGERGGDLKKLMEQGKLVPQKITNELLRVRLSEKDAARGAIIDGYPRDFVQFKALQDFSPPSVVIFLDITDALAVERIAGRRICKCGKIYHMKWNPPKKDDLCDACGSKLVQRPDDHAEAVKERLAIYHRETEPVIAEYRKLGTLRVIDASQKIHMVHEDILKSLGI